MYECVTDTAWETEGRGTGVRSTFGGVCVCARPELGLGKNHSAASLQDWGMPAVPWLWEDWGKSTWQQREVEAKPLELAGREEENQRCGEGKY